MAHAYALAKLWPSPLPPPTSPKPKPARRKKGGSGERRNETASPESGEEGREDLSSPDILEGEPVDPYDYVNADLGPGSN